MQPGVALEVKPGWVTPLLRTHLRQTKGQDPTSVLQMNLAPALGPSELISSSSSLPVSLLPLSTAACFSPPTPLEPLFRGHPFWKTFPHDPIYMAGPLLPSTRSRSRCPASHGHTTQLPEMEAAGETGNVAPAASCSSPRAQNRSWHTGGTQ